MKQVFQNLSSGKTELVDTPVPRLRRGSVLIETQVSLISAGTERMLVDFGRAGLMAKARQQPERVRQVLEKVSTDGLLTTVDAVRAKLGQPIPLGYCNVGIVRQSKAEGLQPGDRVVSNGPHADLVVVPRNLCARIPDNVDDESAAFTVLSSIGLQGIRLARPTLGECFVVTGAGLIGLLTVQLLVAHGCRVLAIDFDVDRLELASRFGAETCNPGAGEDPVATGIAFSRGVGVDGVIITASTSSSDPITEAAHMSRKRGRIVLVGATGLKLNRADFYEKELTFQVSCSYGPGRYDSEYEERGHDYPIGFVRWTEQRNFEAVLDILALRALNVAPLVSHRVPFEDASRAYDLLTEDKKALGIVLDYGRSSPSDHDSVVTLRSCPNGAQKASTTSVGFLGAGNYASRVLIPSFRKSGALMHTICSSGGAGAAIQGRSAGFLHATSDADRLILDDEISTLAVVTRHNTHAHFATKALRAGKHVFVEKPLALTLEELNDVSDALVGSNRHLMVGFNRRFSPLVVTMKKLLASVRSPKAFVMVMNAGAIPPDHWTQDPDIGGGRIVGEACHYLDLMRFLAGSPIISMQTRRIDGASKNEVNEDKAAILLGFEDGSFGTIHYLANGGNSFPKERIEVFAAGRTLQLDNFIRLRGFNWPGFRKQRLWRQDKGQDACVAAFMKAVETGGAPPIPHAELFEVAKLSIEAAESIRMQQESG